MVLVVARFAYRLHLGALVRFGLAQTGRGGTASPWSESSYNSGPSGNCLGGRTDPAYCPFWLAYTRLAQGGRVYRHQIAHPLGLAMAHGDGVDEIGELPHGGLAGAGFRAVIR